MKKLKSLIALLLVALLALSCVACSSSTPAASDAQSPSGETANDQPAASTGAQSRRPHSTRRAAFLTAHAPASAAASPSAASGIRLPNASRLRSNCT